MTVWSCPVGPWRVTTTTSYSGVCLSPRTADTQDIDALSPDTRCLMKSFSELYGRRHRVFRIQLDTLCHVHNGTENFAFQKPGDGTSRCVTPRPTQLHRHEFSLY